MPKIHLDSILIYICFMLLIVLIVMLLVDKTLVQIKEDSDVSMYSMPSWTYAETTTSESTEETEEPEDTEYDDEEYDDEEYDDYEDYEE